MPSILLIDDDTDLNEFPRMELESTGFAVECLERAEHGPERLAQKPFDLVLLDNKMPGMTGIEFLQALRSRKIEVPVIMMTNAGTADTAIQAMNFGAFDYIIKADTNQQIARELEPLMRAALDITRPVKEVQVAPAPRTPTGPTLVVGKCRTMVNLCKEIGLFARSQDAVLILGETGTGKELVARAIHTNSPRKGKPFVALNCTALNESLLESELFGHEAGAFTGADKLRKGKIEYASGGTLFLDEIGDMPLHLQAKLLRVLEYQEVERVGSNEPIKVDVRLLSATHRDVEAAIQEGKFRRDLFHRLNRVTLRLPPLRERLEDLPELVEYFLTRAAEATSRSRPAVAESTLERLRARQWPGNVRELQNVIFRAFGVCRGPQLLPTHLDFSTENVEKSSQSTANEALANLHRLIVWAWDAEKPKNPDGTEPTLWEFLHNRLEEELLKFALARCDWNQTKVADQIGMARTTVIKRMQAYNLKPPGSK